MKIIALRSQDNCGKTETLNLVYDMVVVAGGIPTGKKNSAVIQKTFRIL